MVWNAALNLWHRLPHGLGSVSGVLAQQSLGHIATGYLREHDAPQVMLHLARPGAYPGVTPPWPTPALPRILPVPLPGALRPLLSQHAP